jgi:hypothetical protein
MVLPALRDSCVCLAFVGTDRNFSAVRSPIELKLGGDLRLVSQISVHVLVSRFDCFSYCKQTKGKKKRRKGENRDFRKLEISPPFQVQLI